MINDLTTKDLSSRQVKDEEARQLGVNSGWYTTKMNGTFVSGPHASQEEAQAKILELRPPALPKRKAV